VALDDSDRAFRELVLDDLDRGQDRAEPLVYRVFDPTEQQDTGSTCADRARVVPKSVVADVLAFREREPLATRRLKHGWLPT
jgi:hypothetical protein